MKGLIILFFFIVVSCSEDVVRLPKPKQLVSEDKMVKIMIDMVSTESYLQNEYTSMASFAEVMKKAGNNILAKNSVSTESFTGSLDYYASQVEPMKRIYATTLDSLSSRLVRIKK
jgi:hypothetical protein